MTKEKRNISGIYFRYQNPETNKWENWVFEDLPEEEQNNILSIKSPEFIAGLCRALADTINRLANQFDIVSE